MPAHTNPKLRDVVGSFLALPTRKPDDVAIVAVPGAELVASHVQGVARIGNGYAMPHSNIDGHDGCLIVDDGSRKGRTYPLAEGAIDGLHLSHPSGCQAAGDYLVLAFESIPANRNVSRVVFFDLSDPTKPERLTTPTPIERRGQKAGAVGIANLTVTADGTESERWFVGIYDNGRVDLWRSDGRVFPSTEFAFQFSDTIPDGYEGFCLVAEESNRLFAIGFRRDSRLRDKAELYAVHLDRQRLELLESREFHPNPIQNTHFRWGTGVDVRSSEELAILVSGRNFLPICHINTFATGS